MKLENSNDQIKNKLTQLRAQGAEGAQGPAPPDTDDVREWKRRACEEVLELTAPAGKAIVVQICK